MRVRWATDGRSPRSPRPQAVARSRSCDCQGPTSSRIAERLLRPAPQAPRQAVRAHVVDPDDGSVLDDVIVTRFIAPPSFTGEDLLEITTHGGYRAPTAVLAAAIRAGRTAGGAGRVHSSGRTERKARPASGRGDRRPDRRALRAAQRQHCGNSTAACPTRVLALRERILQVEALLAYDIDFPEEDDGPIPRERSHARRTERRSTTTRAAGDGRSRAR